jgi:hypothetical protein
MMVMMIGSTMHYPHPIHPSETLRNEGAQWGELASGVGWLGVGGALVVHEMHRRRVCTFSGSHQVEMCLPAMSR